MARNDNGQIPETTGLIEPEQMLFKNVRYALGIEIFYKQGFFQTTGVD